MMNHHRLVFTHFYLWWLETALQFIFVDINMLCNWVILESLLHVLFNLTQGSQAGLIQ